MSLLRKPHWKLARSIPSSSRAALQCPPTHRGKSGRHTSLLSSPARPSAAVPCGRSTRSEEHTSELQSRPHLVCRLLLEKKKKKTLHHTRSINVIFMTS